MWAQEQISGKVVTENQQGFSNVTVVNINSFEKTATDAFGNFIINAKSGEELRFVYPGYERRSVVIPSKSFLKVILLPMPIEIEKVIIKPKLSGDLNKDSKFLTKKDLKDELITSIGLPKPPEKLREKPAETINDVLLPILGGSLNVQAAYDIISGKARKQKNLYKFEDFEEKLTWLKNAIDPQFFVRNKINEIDEIPFLKFALHRNSNLNQCFKTKNSAKAELILAEMLPQYLRESSKK